MPSSYEHGEDTRQNETILPSPRSRNYNLFATPATVKRLFAIFPLVTYASNELPVTAPQRGNIPTLYVFNTTEDASRDAPSYNPSCLKWQAYLKFLAIEFTTVSSNNHASPTGALPFLLPTANASIHTPAIRSSALQKWALERTSNPQNPLSPPQTQKQSAYLSLLDGPIRLAYLHTLYLTPSVFEGTAQVCYVNPSSHNALVRISISHSLKDAAEAEIVASCKTPRVDVKALYRDTEDALEAFSILLGGTEWFETCIRDDAYQKSPGLLDAALFSYTHFCMRVEIRERRLGVAVRKFVNLVQHYEKILERYF